jgi:hypothetical protein
MLMPRYFEEDEPRRRYDDDAPRRRLERDDDDDYRPRRKKGTSRVSIVLGVLVGMIFVSAICYGIYEAATKGTPQAAVAYNDKLVSADQRLTNADQQFYNAVNQWMDGQDARSVRSSYEQLQQQCKATAAEVQTWSVPGSNSAKNLHAGFVRYLETRQKDGLKLAEVPKILENHGLSIDQKDQKVNAILQQYESAMVAANSQLARLQQEFAREHSFILNPPPAPQMNPNPMVPRRR